VLISAYPEGGYNTGKVTRAVFERLGELELPTGYSLRAGGEIEARQEVSGGIGTAVLVAVFGILAVLVLEFGSFRSMLIVAGVIPLGVAGGLIALLVTGYTLSFTATIGSCTDRHPDSRTRSCSWTSAPAAPAGRGARGGIVRAGEIRFLPILLTSATAIAACCRSAVQARSLFTARDRDHRGLVSSTLLGGIVTPVMYGCCRRRSSAGAGASGCGHCLGLGDENRGWG